MKYYIYLIIVIIIVLIFVFYYKKNSVVKEGCGCRAGFQSREKFSIDPDEVSPTDKKNKDQTWEEELLDDVVSHDEKKHHTEWISQDLMGSTTHSIVDHDVASKPVQIAGADILQTKLMCDRSDPRVPTGHNYRPTQFGENDEELWAKI